MKEISNNSHVITVIYTVGLLLILINSECMHARMHACMSTDEGNKHAAIAMLSVHVL